MGWSNKNHKKGTLNVTPSFKKAGKATGVQVDDSLSNAVAYIRKNELNKRKKEPKRAAELMCMAANRLLAMSQRWPNGEISLHCQKKAMYYLIILGENTRHIDNRVQGEYPDIPWKNMMGVRNFLAHNPQRAENEFWDLMSDFIRHDLPVINTRLHAVYSALSQQPSWTP